ncbi:MAG: hypothetical protein HYY84_04555 [Deltaproteobacteria bacterium]|nr:hypothetical protein [Deltaproteobacteria bacterium]
MKAKNELEKLLPKLAAISATDVAEPDRPVATIVQEALDLADAAHRYRASLLAVGVDAAIIDGLAERAKALSAAQTEWTNTRETGLPATLHAAVDRATELRRDIVDSALYALRNDDAALDVIARIRDGEGVADLCQDLKDLGVLVERNRAAFDRVDFDFEDVTRARAIADEVQKGHAEATTKKALDDKKDLRNRAFTYLDEAVDEVRAAGLFAFRRDADATRTSLFRSAYALRRGRKSRAAAPASASASAPATAPASATASNCAPR